MAETIQSPIPTYLLPQHEGEKAQSLANTGSQSNNDTIPTIQTTPARTRPWSSLDMREPKAPVLSPSPAFLEPARSSKDDTCVASDAPVTPKRPGAAPRGLSLQLSMPPRDISSSSTANLSTNLTNRTPLSPKLDASPSYATPASVLPRRSRGLDYTRACTNLHHSTLAEQSSPDSSPVIGSGGGGRGLNIPRRGQACLAGPDSPMFAGSLWSSNGGSEKAVVSSSLGSVNMMESGSDSESSDDDLMRDEDTIHMTPQINKHGSGMVNPFNNAPMSSPIADTKNHFGQAAANLFSFQRRTRRGRSTRQSSSSASGTSSMPSPAPGSPPLLKSIESNMSGSYFVKDQDVDNNANRRQSLSLGTSDLHMGDSVEVDEPDQRQGATDALGIPISATSTMDERRSVIRRAVTRRSNMMVHNLHPQSRNRADLAQPKPKTFARIRAALQEEGSPVDAESKREAEVIRQVRESDHSPESTAPASQPPTTASSPYLMPATSGAADTLDDLTEMMGAETPIERRPSESFSRQALRNSTAGPDFWNNFDSRVRTPPPQLLPRGSSSAFSEDVNMDTPASSLYSAGPRYTDAGPNSSPSRSTTPVPTLGEMTRKTLGKRRRDDDLDPNLFKRRAVSPGLSLQNSPVLPPSPMQKDGGWWSTKANRETPSSHANGDRVGSNGSQSGSGIIGKRVGMQGMNDTNDGLMNMSIE
ncbi:MAG: hypothetical protein MMC23_009498 [Stictis urceolatum]|nr:hypothetical protein [Stictis urceolata]